MASFCDLEQVKPMTREEVQKLITELPTERDRTAAERIVERTQRMMAVTTEKMRDAAISRQLDCDWRHTAEVWRRLETRDLERIRQSAELRLMREAMSKDDEEVPVRRIERKVAPTQLKFDDRAMGKLANVEPLQEGELERLYQGLTRKSDQEQFMGLVKDYETRHLENGFLARDFDREAIGVWEFGQEFERRRLARDLREFCDHVRVRDERARDRNRER